MHWCFIMSKKSVAGFGSIILVLSFVACAANTDATEEEPAAQSSSEDLSTINCTVHSETGYVSGKPFALKAVTVDSHLVQIHTADAYYVMAEAAKKAGVNLQVVSGFRSEAEQKYLYHCYTSCSCNNCNLAAPPGYSNHQSGHALDLNTSSPGVYHWLENHAAHFGFKRTVPSEIWHWEWWGGGPGGGPC
jgi:LAS superfamily LD-carboxypeptidase LdcB